jgi:hypothetical protein
MKPAGRGLTALDPRHIIFRLPVCVIVSQLAYSPLIFVLDPQLHQQTVYWYELNVVTVRIISAKYYAIFNQLHICEGWH